MQGFSTLKQINAYIKCIMVSYKYQVKNHLYEIKCVLLYMLFNGLPPVCMKYTARGESQVAIIAGGEVL